MAPVSKRLCRFTQFRQVSYASTPRRLRTLRGSPLSRCSSAPTVGCASEGGGVTVVTIVIGNN